MCPIAQTLSVNPLSIPTFVALFWMRPPMPSTRRVNFTSADTRRRQLALSAVAAVPRNWMSW